MTDEQINAAIADATGWTAIWGERCDPDYCNDLNEMHEAEKVLTYEQCLFVRNHLRERLENYPASLFVWNATARQRAEAFLRTLGKWKEEQK